MFLTLEAQQQQSVIFSLLFDIWAQPSKPFNAGIASEKYVHWF